MDEDYGAGAATFRTSRLNGRPLRGRSGGTQYDRNRLLNTTANVLAGLCVAPTILGILILFLIHFEWTGKPIVISSVARLRTPMAVHVLWSVPAGRCVFVWKGVPPVYADDYDYLALSSKVALIFEYLAESPGTTYEWLQEADSLGRGLSVGGVAVGRSRPMSPDGRLLLGGVLADNSSSGLFACDGREPLASPLRSFQLLVKRASSH
ncbi:hypothetical protein IscW_ISCW018071 [Ixodes scapularis]|uniref:Uncharacterized protein n=1 Tax=Ixodes scapularis TaxID=6945 RepID=B7PGR8_IXOSC|nr:hypothetical protein IscW_ISCW018071 [Ixodes scapularis]|eukprot:XP_002401370.1 hypothetical protein IscW_ISCW018071 [Ixodes scapularis]